MSDSKSNPRSGRGGGGSDRAGGRSGAKGAGKAGGKAGGGRSGGRGGQAGKAGKGGKGQGRAGAPRSGARDQDDTVAQLAGPLQNVLKRLPATQREVLEWRMGLKDGHPTPIGETAKHLGLTLHEAKEIEKRAFEHIREAIPLDRLQKLLKG